MGSVAPVQVRPALPVAPYQVGRDHHSCGDSREQHQDDDESQRLSLDHDSPPSTFAMLAPVLAVTQVAIALTSAFASATE
jgi:hypothetical protein